jgi:glycosyltransferase involved in cell wall biosynthesis
VIRVAFVLPSFAGGGAERVMITVANALDRAAFTARLIVLDGSGPLAELVARDVPVTVLARPRLRTALPALRRALRAEPTDIALSTLGYLNVGMLLLRPLLPSALRLVVREANMPLSGTGGRVGRALAAATRLLYPRADRVLCPAQRIADDLADRYRVPAVRLRVIPNPVDIERLRALAMPPRRHPGPGLRLVAAGRLVEQKGHARLLELMPTLPVDTHLTILGDGPLREALAERIADLGLSGRVELGGFDVMPWPRYAGADVFVLPSLWEGLPNAALEALAVGTPVVATPEAGGIGEVAEVASPGAVTIAEAGAPLASAIRQVMPRDRAELRPSLLPEPFVLEQVVARYAGELKSVARGIPATSLRSIGPGEPPRTP